MRPGRRIFATNAVWAAGPDAGSPVKLPMSAGELADGRYRSIRPAPQLDNHLLWNLGSRLDSAAAMAVRNLVTEPVTAVGFPGAWNGIVPDGAFDPTPTRIRHTVVDGTPLAFPIEWQSRGGRFWGVVAAPATNLGVPRIAVDGLDSRVIVTGANTGGLDNPWFSTAYGVWTIWTVPTLDRMWVDVDFGTGNWVIVEPAGGILNYANAVGNAFAAPITPPAFVPCTTISVAHSHHNPGDLYPDDPGNDMWVSLTNTQTATCTNINNWTTALHGLGAVPGDLGYSRVSGEWIAVDHLSGIDRSVDGLVWTRSAAGAAGGLFTAIAAPTTGRIATDGYGHWVVVLVDSGAGKAEIHSSADDGATWQEIWPDIIVPALVTGTVWYGDGSFHVVVEDGVGGGAIYSTLRASE